MTTGGQPTATGGGEEPAPDRWVLTLYVSGSSARSMAAVEAVHNLCDTELAGRVDLRVVDVHDEPALLMQNQVVATPTLVKQLPLPLRRLVGDLSDIQRVRLGLDLVDDNRTVPSPEENQSGGEGPIVRARR